jgi:hypothetical protein
MKQTASLYERVIARPRPVWVKVCVSLFLLTLPFAITILSGMTGEMINHGLWRYLLLTPSIIIYIWLGSPILDRQSKEVTRSLRTISALDDESYSAFLEKTQTINPRSEWIVIGVGSIVGLAINSASEFGETGILFQVYWTLSMVVMYALMAWIIYLSVLSTRTGDALLRQPLHINIFNPAPFEAIGRQGLLLAMMFIGGITLSLVFSFRVENLAQPLFWLIYLSLMLVTLLIFFVSMRPAHNVLAKKKVQELTSIRRTLELLGQELLQCVENQQDASKVASEFNALAAYEGRLLGVRTWPYNTSMLRTLFFSFLVPLASFGVKTVIDLVLPK